MATKMSQERSKLMRNIHNIPHKTKIKKKPAMIMITS